MTSPSGSSSRKLLPAALLLVSVGGLFAAAWLFPGFVECRGYTEPANWIALYAPGSGPVVEGRLEDRMTVAEGEILLRMDTSWPEHNLRRIELELTHLESEHAYLEHRLELFTAHRDVEAAELLRLLETDRILEKSSSVSLNQLLHTEYLYESYLAATLRDEADFQRSASASRDRRRELEMERRLWEERLRDCVLTAPAGGIYYPSEDVFAPHGAVFLPPVGPGRRLEEGDLLGFIVPDDRLEVFIRIPEVQAGECHAGQRVLLTADSRAADHPPPAEGILKSISSLASGGSVEAVVTVASFEGEMEFFCGSLSARIDTREPRAWGLLPGLWERWVLMVNPI